MKYHGTALACSFAPYKVSSRLFCPRCHDQIIAATRSEHVSTTEIHHWWACESCGYEYRTTVRWLQSFDEVEPSEDDIPLGGLPADDIPLDTLAVLPNERDTLAWNVPNRMRKR